MPLPRRKHFPRTEESKSMPSRLGSAWGGIDSGRGRQPWVPGSRMDFERAAGSIGDNSVVSVCLAWLRRQLPQGEIKIGVVGADGQREPIEDHPLAAILRRPNPIWSRAATLGGASDCLGIDGNAYWLKARDGGGRLREIYWAPNHAIELEYASDSASVHPVDWYWYLSGGAQRKRYGPRDVVHFRAGIDPERPAKGISDLKRQIRNIAGLNHGERYSEAILRKGRAGIVLTPRDPLQTAGGYGDPSPDEVEMASEKLRMERALSTENAGGIHATNLPMSTLNIGLTPEQMMLDRILDRPEAMVTAALGLNSLVLGLPSSSDSRTYSNYAEARRDAWESAVIPLQDLIADEICRQLLYTVGDDGEIVPEFAGDSPDLVVWWDRANVAALREDAAERANRTNLLFTSTALPRNRALAEGGFDPVDDEPGEQYYGDPSPTAMEQAEIIREQGGGFDPNATDEPDDDAAPEPDDDDEGQVDE